MLAITIGAFAPLVHAADTLQIEAGAILDTFDRSYLSTWRSNYLEGEKKLADGLKVYGSLRETERFALKDTEASAGLYSPLADRWSLVTEGSISPSHNVLPAYSVLEQAQYAFTTGAGVQLGLRHTEYVAAVTNSMPITLEQYWSDYRAAYTHTVSTLAAAGNSPNDRLQLSWYYDDRSWIGALYSSGSEITNLGTPWGITSVSVQSTALYGRHWLDRDWAVSYELSTNTEGTFYTRNGFRLGLRRQF